jgi:hypothetical protein
MFQHLLAAVYVAGKRFAGYATYCAFCVGRHLYPDCSLVSAIRSIIRHQRPSNENGNRSQVTSGAHHYVPGPVTLSPTDVFRCKAFGMEHNSCLYRKTSSKCASTCCYYHENPRYVFAQCVRHDQLSVESHAHIVESSKHEIASSLPLLIRYHGSTTLVPTKFMHSIVCCIASHFFRLSYFRYLLGYPCHYWDPQWYRSE